MKQFVIWACIVSLFLFLRGAKSDEELARNALLTFISKLSNGNGLLDLTSGWNASSYPCKDQWRGVVCDVNQPLVTKILLRSFDFQGSFDARVLCSMQSLSESLLVIDVFNNNIRGENLEDIANCSKLTQLLIGKNQFSGHLPNSISQLKNLNTLDVSQNEFSGSLPDFSTIPGMMVFLAQDNQFSGSIPTLNFSNFSEFNVSYNNLSGAIPDGAQKFDTSGFIHNPQLCGAPLPTSCTSMSMTSESDPTAPQTTPKKGGNSHNQIIIFIGYMFIGVAILSIILLCLYKRGMKKDEKLDSTSKIAAFDDSIMKPSFSTVDLKAGEVSKTDISATSAENSMVSSSLIVLTTPEDANGMRFEDLLKAPAELLGRGEHGSVYKVSCTDQGTTLAVKRIKDWAISSSEFKQRMRRLNSVKHPHVLPAIAFYSSREEKLLVYEYQQNGNLFRKIHAHGNQTSQPLDWTSRLSIAATIADALAFMHNELKYDRIPHGNLKSTNILLNDDMEPCISEYGLMVENIPDNQPISTIKDDFRTYLFKADTYAFGVILLELLTGRMALNDGLDLASWIFAAVREEWTVEVFDKNLIREGASEERMLNMLHVAIKCVNKTMESRPSMNEVASMIRAIREDDDKSMEASGLSMTVSFIDV